MIIKELSDYIESLAPLSYQESYDNSGLLVGSSSDLTEKALITLDVTEAVLDEAIAGGFDLIIAHHPLIFRGVKQINNQSEVGRCIIKAVKNGIAIYTAHTNLDNVTEGVNKKICQKLSLTNCEILAPLSNTLNTVGAGMKGELPEEVEEIEFLQYVKKVFGLKVVKHSPLLGTKIKKVAVCGGAGSFLIGEAIESKASVFLTGDLKYHQFFEAEQKIVLADIGHFESEQFTCELFYELIMKKFPNFAVRLSGINTNPVNYLI